MYPPPPLDQEPVKQPVPQSAHHRSSLRTDGKLDGVVKVSALMIDVIPEPVDIPVPTGFGGAKDSIRNTPPLVWKMTSKDELSVNKVMVDRPPQPRILLGWPVALLEMSPLVWCTRPTSLKSSPSVWCHRPTLLETSPLVWRPRPNLWSRHHRCRVLGRACWRCHRQCGVLGRPCWSCHRWVVTIGVASSAELAGDVTASVAPSADPDGDVTASVTSIEKYGERDVLQSSVALSRTIRISHLLS